jgi:hypothetical protein
MKANIGFSSKITDTIKKKSQFIIHDHKNIVKSTQNHQLAPGVLPLNVLIKILTVCSQWLRDQI